MITRLRILVALLFVVANLCQAQSSFSCCQKANNVLNTIHKAHVQPTALDSSFSKLLFTEFVQSLDPNRIYFSREDLVELKFFETTLIDHIQANNPLFLEQTHKLFANRIKEYETWMSEYLSKPIDFNAADLLPLQISNKNFASRKDIKKEREYYLKLKVLERIHDKVKSSTEKKSTAIVEADARSIVLTNEKHLINKIATAEIGIENHIYKIFLESIAKSFDPHTSYFTSSAASEFTSSLSEESLSFGIEVDKNDFDETIISRVIPAGPAWNSNQIHVGDRLLKLLTPDKKSFDLSVLDIDEVEEIIHAQNLLHGDIMIQKADGNILTISLTKAVIERSENVIKSFILSGSSKIGYISLPSFYTKWENEKEPGCANDMAKELIKLKKENIAGLILDLRFNGGGSLEEALNLAGVFIDTGPLTVIKEASKPPFTLKDLNKGTIYDGPLLILVNGFSASASEVLAATLQDYNRAIIAGTSTFGKASGQIIMPVTGEKDFIKVTIDKIYRITGKSYQQTGVTPDIELPDFTQFIPIRERHYANPLPSDDIIKKTYFTPLPQFPLDSLKKRSNDRLMRAASFSELQNLGKRITSPIELTVTGYTQYKNEMSSLFTTMRFDEAGSKSFKVLTPQFDKALLTIDDDRNEVDKKLLQEIAQSMYIHEAYLILLDYIQLQNKK